MAPVTSSEPTEEDVAAVDQLESLMMGRALAHLAAIKHGDEVEALTWERLEAGCLASPQYRLLHSVVQQGVSNNSKDWDLPLQPYFRHSPLSQTAVPAGLLIFSL